MREDKKVLISTFACFLTAIVKGDGTLGYISTLI